MDALKVLGLALGLVTLLAGEGRPASRQEDRAAELIRQAREYSADEPKTIVELQPFRHGETLAIDGPDGAPGSATLINLSPAINSWFLLTLQWGRSAEATSYHLENASPRTQALQLSGGERQGIRIAFPGGSVVCPLWAGSPASPLETARRSALPYSPLCDGRLYLRNQVGGRYTSLEKVTNILRDYVPGGESVVDFVRKEFYGDAYLEEGMPGTASGPFPKESAQPDRPRPADLGPSGIEETVTPEHLGIDLGLNPRRLIAGRWYPASSIPGVYLSAVEPGSIAPEILASYPDLVTRLDRVEANALDYLVAFDLSEFDLGFELGTDHPRVGWSDRVAPGARAANLPGPDGINTARPLATTGMVSPALAGATVATFTGGFKRQHGAFKYPPLSVRNHASHYGFVEQGSIFSKLQPGLSTLYVLDDGTVGLRTWTPQDDELLFHIRQARQNGVPLIDYDRRTGLSAPGALVAKWGPGNWSGSADEDLRTLRAGICLQETGARRFLIYGYFSAATPSAMVRVFQAYGCRYAMHLDMNALEHTYLALYQHVNGKLLIEHLIEGMAEVDKSVGGKMLPRFLAFPDNRDFFFLTRRGTPP